MLPTNVGLLYGGLHVGGSVHTSPGSTSGLVRLAFVGGSSPPGPELPSEDDRGRLGKVVTDSITT